MVKGISRQVIVVNTKDHKLFDQAIFILSDGATKGEGISQDRLWKEANRLLKTAKPKKRGFLTVQNLLFAFLGAVLACGIWLFLGIG